MTKAEMIERFKAFCQSKAAKAEALEEYDWTPLSVGFFIALGASVDDAEEMATTVRYTFHYWW
jgi:hypothetical protein